MTARTVPGQRMAEGELLSSVLELCAWLGLLAHHCRPAWTEKGWRTPIQGDRGMPDIVIVGGGGVLYVELKGDTGSLDREQRQWRDVLLASGQQYRLWRPEHWLSGAVRDELTALARGTDHA